MKSFIILGVAMLAAAPAVAQDHSKHAPVPAPPAAPATVAAKFSLDTPIETLMADPGAKAALETGLPGLATHESYDMFKSMSLNQLAPMAPDRLTPAVLAKVQASLAAVK
jgi:hypothetical protein